VKLKTCIPGLLTTLERAIVGKIDLSHYLRILVPQDVHFTLEIRPRENALKSLETLKDMLRNLGWEISDSTQS